MFIYQRVLSKNPFWMTLNDPSLGSNKNWDRLSAVINRSQKWVDWFLVPKVRNKNLVPKPTGFQYIYIYTHIYIYITIIYIYIYIYITIIYIYIYIYI